MKNGSRRHASATKKPGRGMDVWLLAVFAVAAVVVILADRGFFCNNAMSTTDAEAPEETQERYQRAAPSTALASARRQPEVYMDTERLPYEQLNIELLIPDVIEVYDPLRVQPVTSDDGLLGPEHPDFDELSWRFDRLIRTHPHPYVFIDLYDMVKSDEILWNLNIEAGLAGGFALTCEGGAPVRSSCRPVIAINPELLAGMSTLKGLLEAWNALYHEVIHLRQWLEASDEETAYWLDWFGNGTPELTRESCAFQWRLEHEAFWRECEFSAQTGFGNSWSFCRAMGASDTWNRALAGYMTSEYYGEHYGDCVTTWRELGDIF